MRSLQRTLASFLRGKCFASPKTPGNASTVPSRTVDETLEKGEAGASCGSNPAPPGNDQIPIVSSICYLGGVILSYR